MSYEEFKKSFIKRLKNEINHWHHHCSLLPLAELLALKWGDTTYKLEERFATVTYAFGVGAINAVSIDLHLGKHDTLTKDFNIFVEEEIVPVLERVGLKMQEPDSPDPNWKMLKYVFTDKDRRVLCRGWFDHSIQCRIVPTGNKVEEMKVVCEERMP
jgi:hypothetical protein